MEQFISVLELIGAWLLFGAPLLQSVTELYEELDKREKLVQKINDYNSRKTIKSISFWWWLFPPIKIILEKNKIKKIKKLTDNHLSKETKNKLHRLSVKANGWSGVTSGGWLVAVSTTWNFAQSMNLSIYYWLLIICFGSYASIFAVIREFRHRAI